MIKLSDGNWCDDAERMKAGVVNFFRSLFTSSGTRETVWTVTNLFAPLSDVDKSRLVSTVTEEEVRRVIFYMDPLKAPEIDRIHAMFYQRNWTVVKDSVVNFVRECFATQELPTAMNRTMLVLIPKVASPESLHNLGQLVYAR
ncbi:hypothetical protein like AT1G43760 [Hibiscus trionum]|uniref:Uncharacterized protein n=1 Tax=Hibiscus trionum TaxID=183268 RepID=A0A9W7ISD2_HIBTR|nr:hypothetical protein like AT1G43760 [Hibiscus trionum]